MAFITDPAELLGELIAHRCQSGGPVAIDTETVGCDPRKQSPIGNAVPLLISFAWADKCAVIEVEDILGCEYGTIFDEYERWFNDRNIHKVGTNIFGYDKHVLANVGIKLRGVVGDTLRMSRLLNPAQLYGHGLKDWGERLGFNVVDFKTACTVVPHAKLPKIYKKSRTVRKGGVTTSFTAGTEVYEIYWGRKKVLPLDEIKRDYPAQWLLVKEYAAQDALMSLQVYWHLKHKLEEVKW